MGRLQHRSPVAGDEEHVQTAVLDGLDGGLLPATDLAQKRGAAGVHDAAEGLNALLADGEVVADVEEHLRLEDRLRCAERARERGHRRVQAKLDDEGLQERELGWHVRRHVRRRRQHSVVRSHRAP